MPHEGYADPVTNDGPRFHSDIPVRELNERITRAIEESDVSSAPPVAKTTDGVMHETQLTPTEPNGAQGLGTPQHLRMFDAWIHDSDSPDPSARPTPRSVTPTLLIPRCAQRLDP